MLDPCLPAVHTAKTLSRWAIWRAKNPLWHWHPSLAACTKVAGVALPLLALRGATPALPVAAAAPVVVAAPANPSLPYSASYGGFGPGAFSTAPSYGGGEDLSPLPSGFGGGFGGAGGFGSGFGYQASPSGISTIGGSPLPAVEISSPAPFLPIGYQPTVGAQPMPGITVASAQPAPSAPVVDMQPAAPTSPYLPVVETPTQPGTDVPEPAGFAVLVLPLALVAWRRARG